MIKPPTPQEWQLFRRLKAAGCPLRLESIEPPRHPLHVTQVPWSPGYAILPDAGGLGLIAVVRLTAADSISICDLRLEVSGLGVASQVPECAEHADSYCLLTNGKHFLIPRKHVLCPNVQNPVRLKRGGSVACATLGVLKGVADIDHGLDATLWIKDIFGTQYPYFVAFGYQPLPAK